MKKVLTIIQTVFIIFATNCCLLLEKFNIYALLWAIVPLFIICMIFPASDPKDKILPLRLRVLDNGNVLMFQFLFSGIIGAVWQVFSAFALSLPIEKIIINAVVFVVAESIVFWNGIIRLYCTSVQLGIKRRVLGIILAYIPVANLIKLHIIIKTTVKEFVFESEKYRLNEERKDLRICETKYPILLVHGIFFRDSGLIDYWGRIPNELRHNGATVFYGNHESASSIADSGIDIYYRIKAILDKTGCDKVNIIAHSKGGLDARYAISCCGAAPYVASLTTISTPHRGCEFADYLLNTVSEKIQKKVTDTYNSAMLNAGDSDPDFISGVTDLTAKRCAEMNEVMKDAEGVYYSSVGSVLKKARGGRFPLNLTYHLPKKFSGDNDGLVSIDSFAWGSDFTLITPSGKRGVSHADMTDFTKENYDGFDVREFYVKLVKGLKEKGL